MRYLLFLLFSCCTAIAQDLKCDNFEHDYGQVEEAFTLQSTFIVKNNGSKKMYLMRADASKKVKITTSKKTILPGDTATLIVVYNPTEAGKFAEEITLITHEVAPYKFKIKGELKRLAIDNKQSCFYFGKPKPIIAVKKDEPVVTNSNPTKPIVKEEKKDIVKKNTEEEPRKDEPIKTVVVKEPVNVPVQNTNTTEVLPESQYKFNNLIFLVDVSGSMRDSNKIALLKVSMHKLIDGLRTNDKVSLITYADTAKVVVDAVSGSDKKLLHQKIDALHAKGGTKGNRAILLAEGQLLMNYIADGNNQIILATDGKFNILKKDQEKWVSNKGTKELTLTALCFGDDKIAIDNLKALTKFTQGSFIRIKNKRQAEEALLEEIRTRSLKK